VKVICYGAFLFADLPEKDAEWNNDILCPSRKAEHKITKLPLTFTKKRIFFKIRNA
jgi:hypothetical protein